MADTPLWTSDGRRICDLCSDPMGPDESRTRYEGVIVHADCADEAHRVRRRYGWAVHVTAA